MGKLYAVNPIRERARAAFRPDRQQMEWAADYTTESADEVNAMMDASRSPFRRLDLTHIYRNALQAEYERQFEEFFEKFSRGQAYPR